MAMASVAPSGLIVETDTKAPQPKRQAVLEIIILHLLNFSPWKRVEASRFDWRQDQRSNLATTSQRRTPILTLSGFPCTIARIKVNQTLDGGRVKFWNK
jgi:hypothetical protein